MSDWFISLYGLLSVFLRGAVLAAQSLALGGVLFQILVLPQKDTPEPARSAVIRWTRFWALLLAATEILYVTLDVEVLRKTTDLAFGQLLAADFALAGFAAIAASLAIAIFARAETRNSFYMLVPSAVMLGATITTSHAIGQLHYRLPLAMLTGVHQASIAAWIGGLPYLLIVLKQTISQDLEQRICGRFSRQAMVSVALLATAGVALGYAYVGSWDAVSGTAYGIMVLGKTVLLGILLCVGALNFRIVRGSQGPGPWPVVSLRRFGEAEIGLGFSVVLLAASLTSVAPAVDTPKESLTTREIAALRAPQSPQPMFINQGSAVVQKPPQILDISSRDPAAPPDSSLTERVSRMVSAVPSGMLRVVPWKEDPHHWAALVVLSVGLLALLGHLNGFRAARNWPLLFTALGLILMLWSDSQYWPLGQDSFFSSFLDPIVLPHRIIEIFLIVFGIFEWQVQTGRSVSSVSSLVFPALVVLSSTLLLTHVHSSGDAQIPDQLMPEASHIEIAILGVTAGWSRWLEVRLPQKDQTRKWMSWVWPVCILLIGVVLSVYREIE